MELNKSQKFTRHKLLRLRTAFNTDEKLHAKYGVNRSTGGRRLKENCLSYLPLLHNVCILFFDTMSMLPTIQQPNTECIALWHTTSIAYRICVDHVRHVCFSIVLCKYEWSCRKIKTSVEELMEDFEKIIHALWGALALCLNWTENVMAKKNNDERKFILIYSQFCITSLWIQNKIIAVLDFFNHLNN